MSHAPPGGHLPDPVGTDVLEEMLGGLKPSSCLDIATGVGASLETAAGLLPSARLLVGMDISRANLARTGTRFGGSGFLPVAGDGHAPPFGPGAFDSVVIVNSLHHFHDPAGVLREAARLLSQGGFMIVSEMYRSRQGPARDTHVLLHGWWARIDRLNGVPHYETLTRRRLLGMPCEAGLRVEAFTDSIGEIPEPATGEAMEGLRKSIEVYLARIPAGTPWSAGLEREGALLSRRLSTRGFSPAASLSMLLRPDR